MTDCGIKIIFSFIGGGVDYDSGPYNVTFRRHMSSNTLDVPIYDDNILEFDEQFSLTINSSSLPIGFTISDPSLAMVTIIDNDSECKQYQYCCSI